MSPVSLIFCVFVLLFFSCVEKSSPILLVFGIVPHAAVGDELRAMFALKGSDDNNSDSDSVDDEPKDDKGKSTPKDKKSRKLNFGIHFKVSSRCFSSDIYDLAEALQNQCYPFIRGFR